MSGRHLLCVWHTTVNWDGTVTPSLGRPVHCWQFDNATMQRTALLRACSEHFAVRSTLVWRMWRLKFALIHRNAIYIFTSRAALCWYTWLLPGDMKRWVSIPCPLADYWCPLGSLVLAIYMFSHLEWVDFHLKLAINNPPPPTDR